MSAVRCDDPRDPAFGVNPLVAAKAAGSRAMKPGAGGLYYARLKAVQQMRAGWTKDEATDRCTEYGWMRANDKSPRKPLTTLVLHEMAIATGNAYRAAVGLTRYDAKQVAA